jgi:hypothetical protein
MSAFESPGKPDDFEGLKLDTADLLSLADTNAERWHTLTADGLMGTRRRNPHLASGTAPALAQASTAAQ